MTPRDFNISAHLGGKYKCPVKFGVLVIRALSEILKTKNHQDLAEILGELNISEKKIKNLLKKLSVRVAISITNLVLKRLNH